MKRILFVFFSFISLNGYSQNLNYYQWKPIEPGLVCADSFYLRCKIQNFANDTLRDILWMKGRFEGGDTISSPNIIGYNGHDFVPFPFPVTSYDTVVTYDMIMYYGDLYTCSDHAVFKYDFTTHQRNTIGLFPSLSNGECFAVYNGDLYLGGDFYAIQDTSGNWIGAYNIAKWDGVNWSSVGQYGVYNPSAGGGVVYSMEVYNNKLYVGGTFEFADSVEAWNIAAWNGLNWSCLCDGISHFGTNSNNNNHYAATVHDFEIFQGNLYATGNFDSICNVKSKLAFTDGNGWNGTAFPYFDNIIIKSFQNNLIVYTLSLSSFYNVLFWDGTQSIQVDTGFIDGYASFINFHDTLYAGGAFGFSGNTAVFRIAKLVFDSTNVGINETEIKTGEIKIYPNPANDQLIIDNGQLIIDEIEITNALGIHSFRFKVSNPTTQINIKTLAAGLYFVKVHLQNGEILVRKFVRQ